MCRYPERPLEPEEDVVFGYCAACGGEIYAGGAIYRIDGECIHEECLEEFAKDYFSNYKEET